MRSMLRFAASPPPKRWVQLGFAWLIFVVTAGTYMVPPILLGGHCHRTDRSMRPCSVPDEFPSLGPAALGWLPSVFLATKGVLALPAGSALARFGARRCILFGSALLVVVGSLYGVAQSWWHLIWLHAGFGVAYCLCGLVPLVVLANGWLEVERKATGIGILVTGYSAAGVVWPPITAAVADAHGWRTAAAMLPAATLVIALPLTCFLVRDGPSSLVAGRAAPPADASAGVELSGAHSASPARDPGADTASDSAAAVAPPRAGRWWWLREDPVWHLFAISFHLLYLVNAINHLIVLFLSGDANLTLTTASLYTSAIFVSSIVGKLGFGCALDGERRAQAALLGGGLVTLGVALLLPSAAVAAGRSAARLGVSGERDAGPDPPGYGVLFYAPLNIFALLFGVGYGGTFTLVQSRAATLYGRRPGYSQIQSFVALAQYIGSFTGVLLTSQLREATGSFVAPFVLFVPIAAAATMHCWLLLRHDGERLPPQRAADSDGDADGHGALALSSTASGAGTGWDLRPVRSSPPPAAASP